MTNIPQALALLSIYLVVGEGQKVISAGNGSKRGSWGADDLCPENTYARYSQSKYETPGQMDDTYINAIKLYCFDKKDMLVDDVSSKEGKQGEWQAIDGCPNNYRIIGYTMKVQEKAGSLHDDFAVMDVLFVCEDGTLLHPVPSQSESLSAVDTMDKHQPPIKIKPFESDPLENGAAEPVALSADESWGPWAMCDGGSYVCGIKARVERNSVTTDDAGLCDLMLFCCY